MSDLMSKVKSRGYWSFEVRPISYNPERVAFSDLRRLLERSAVDLRGWDVPHVDPHAEIKNGTNWIAQESDWHYYKELWRFFQSGQFLDVASIWDDWRDESALDGEIPIGWAWGKRLGVANTLFRYTEIFEFASRLAATAAGDDSMFIQITLSGLKERVLWNEDPMRLPFRFPRKTSMEEFPFEAEFARADLIAKPRELALEPIIKLFERFDWTPGADHIRDWQAKLGKW